MGSVEVFCRTERHEGRCRVQHGFTSDQDAEINQIIADSKFPDNVQAFIDSASLSVIDNFRVANWNEIHNAIKEHMEHLMLGNQSVADTQQNIVSDVNQLLSE